MKKGILLICVGCAMIIFDIVYEPFFSIPITTGFAFPVGALAVLVGILWVLSAKVAQEKAVLTQFEVAQWGPQLEVATPRIIALSKKQYASGFIAETIEKEMSIPQDILIKYMYAMRNYLQATKERAIEEERRDP